MVAIPLPLTTSPGEVPQEGMGRLINCFAVPAGDSQSSAFGTVWKRAPGLRILGSELAAATWRSWSFPFEEWFNVRDQPTGDGTFLGGVMVNSSTLYCRMGTKFYQVDSTGSLTQLTGTVSGSDKTFFARNNASTPDVVFTCNDGVFILTGGTKAAYPDGDLPSSPTCVCFHDGYFMFGYGNSTIYASDVNSTSINALNFTTAQQVQTGITRLWSFNGQLYAGGTQAIEVFGLPINATAFPLTRVGYNITPGIMGAQTVAGFDPEWGAPPIYVGSDSTVRWLQGFNPVKISPPELDVLIAEASPTDLEALVYIANGQQMWQLSSTDWTWVFNATTQKWHERISYLLSRSRMTLSLPAFNEWICGDTEENVITRIDASITTEVDNPLAAILQTAPVSAFPSRLRVAQTDFDFTVGVGIASGTDPIQTDPEALISWSDDGGATFTSPWVRKLGKQGETLTRVTLRNTGLSGATGRIWKLTVSDPIHFGLTSGEMRAEIRTY